MLIDGVPVRGRLNGQVDLSQLSLNNVERMEIVNDRWLLNTAPTPSPGPST